MLCLLPSRPQMMNFKYATFGINQPTFLVCFLDFHELPCMLEKCRPVYDGWPWLPHTAVNFTFTGKIIIRGQVLMSFGLIVIPAEAGILECTCRVEAPSASPAAQGISRQKRRRCGRRAGAAHRLAVQRFKSRINFLTRIFIDPSRHIYDFFTEYINKLTASLCLFRPQPVAFKCNNNAYI